MATALMTAVAAPVGVDRVRAGRFTQEVSPEISTRPQKGSTLISSQSCARFSSLIAAGPRPRRTGEPEGCRYDLGDHTARNMSSIVL